MDTHEPDKFRQAITGRVATDCRKALEGLERSMAQFHAFQAETLRVHASYLRDQLEVTGSLLGLTQARFSQDSHRQEQAHEPVVAPVTCNPVRLKALPDPDSLDIAFPEGHICLLTDDGTPATARVVGALQARGRPVVVLGFPASVVAKQAPLPEGVSRVVLETLDEAHLKEQLAALSEAAGPIGCFIYLHPPFGHSTGDDLRFSETEKALIKQVFLMAKYLKDPLERAARAGRSCFVTVVRLDGRLGLGENMGFSPLGGGLFGLTKSLNQEWPSVFCRAVDLSPECDPERAARCLLAELYDPDLGLAEVGLGPEGRFTLISEVSG